MVAYSFKRFFVPKIDAGLKNHTIRADRKRHARPGELVQMQHGPRFRPVRFGESPCLFANPIRLNFTDSAPGVFVEHIGRINDALWARGQEWNALGAGEYRNRFAQSDGFDDWEAMARFWWDEHRAKTFEGVIIGWVPLPDVRAAA